MPVKLFDVTAKQLRFISAEIKAGRYRDENEVLQAGLTLLQKQHKQRQTLTEMIHKGIDDADAGRGVTLKSPDEIKAFGKRVLKKVLKTKISS